MEAHLEACFQREEEALNALVDSITSYNPSVSAAQDLLAADEELGRGVELLAAHQSNHAHLQHLRATAAQLEAHLQSSLRLVADTRRDLLAHPPSKPPATGAASARAVPADDLLAYARRVSRYTVPPTFRAKVPPIPGFGADADADKEGGGGAGGAGEGDEPGTHEEEAERARDGAGVAALTAEQREWIQAVNRLPFVPWPSEDVMARGALAHVAQMRAQGRDPAGMTRPLEEAELEARRREEAEERERERRDEDERRRRRDEEEERRRARRGSVAAPPPRRDDRAQAAFFGGLDLYEPDEG
ncbi:vitamin-D-receptor interacting mediator subunit 4-domain-containing protein [Lineolata rhizophorae]|uniref:Mediator of RNA polymerase II transcription subunit 4 n=1 Tax=Lineolata rhizophorae TaxID=578093 RepID=A0A6A6P0A8_9PEZI|nr:vitamin-D-receptor interacting mediator subunit 4-domain-containing protein [Lineolata rhizophorae]